MASTEKNLLVIDDDRLFGHAVAHHFRDEFTVSCATTGEEGVSWCRANRADVVLLDQKLPDCEGISLCETILSCNERAKIIFITGFPSFDHAVRALRNGAHDYLSKPVEFEELDLHVRLAFRTEHLERVEQLQQLQRQQDALRSRLLCLDGGLACISDLVKRAASNRVPVLITGETGTGKTAVAKAIHYLNGEGKEPFIDINCAVLPENLIEAELFGHERGAFTGADRKKEGLFEMAHGGSLFLDEIGEMPQHLQAKLLGVLDSGDIRRLGGNSVLPVDVRVVAATNVDLEKAVAEKRFREDLYYRLSVMRMHIPPLRERKGDIPELVQHFIATISPDREVHLDLGELERMGQYDWPGNVRELRNIIERAIILSNDRLLRPSLLLQNKKPAVSEGHPGVFSTDAIQPLAEVERAYILSALTYFDNNRSSTAKALGIARSTLIRKLEQYSL